MHKAVQLLAACIALTLAAAGAKYVASRQRDLGRMHRAAYVAYVFNVLSLLCLGRSFQAPVLRIVPLLAFTARPP